MALTYAPRGELGSACPDFKLKSVDGKAYSRGDFTGKPLVVMFICNHCPYVRAIEDRLVKLAHSYPAAAFVGICANDSTDHPEDTPPELHNRWREKRYDFPYLVDESQDVARAFAAVCTPDLYVFDSSHKLRYRGRLDDSWRNPNLVKREELREALEKILLGQTVNETQNPSMGCSIKWKNE